MPTLSDLPIPIPFEPMEAKRAETLPEGGGWRYEPKWDGFRCLAYRAGDEVDLRAKSGKPLARYFPDMVEALKALPVDPFVIDGELIIQIGEALHFEALQARLHPAQSRVAKLAAETPADLVLFDCLLDADGRSLLDHPLERRLVELEARFGELGVQARVHLSPGSQDIAQARRWLAGVHGGGGLDGVMAKRLDQPYAAGERAMIKVKRLRTADCVVGGFRYESGGHHVGSLLLGLYDAEGRLDHVGFTATISDTERPALTKRLEALAGGSGFTGDAPGGPSRWSTERSAEWTPLKPELVVEVRYDHVTGDRFRHGTKLVRWRPDKAPRQCTFEQLHGEAAPSSVPTV